MICTHSDDERQPETTETPNAVGFVQTYTQAVDDIVLPEDPRAAKLVTLTLWQSRDGRLFSQEHEDSARWSGATHTHCRRCKEPAKKSWILCDTCRAEHAKERHAARKVVPWDGVAMIYSHVLDEYFSYPESILDHLDSHEIEARLSDLQLVICQPNHPRIPDVHDFYYDDLPEDGELPEQVEKAFAELAKALEGSPVLSWTYSNEAVDIASLGIADDAALLSTKGEKA